MHPAPLHVFWRACRCGKELNDLVLQLRFAHTRAREANWDNYRIFWDKAEVLPLITCHHSTRPLNTAQTDHCDEILLLEEREPSLDSSQTPRGEDADNSNVVSVWHFWFCAAQTSVQVHNVQVKLTGFALEQWQVNLFVCCLGLSESTCACVTEPTVACLFVCLLMCYFFSFDSGSNYSPSDSAH